MLLIVGIGASAGGLEAFKAFLANMPPDSGMAFVLVQHLSPDHKSMLAELLGHVASMSVIEARNGAEVKANCVFVIPPDSTLTIRNGRLKLTQPAPPRDRRRPIDAFFQSLAEDQGENAIGIVLAGTGSDGSVGLTAIKERGGLTLAQAGFDHQAMAGMPQSAASTGQVDEVLAVDAMPARLLAYKQHLTGVADTKDDDGKREDTVSQLAKIMAALQARSGHDFSGYKEESLVRRLRRRMQVLHLDTPDAYVAHYRKQPEELDRLFRELLIGVTGFFRDPGAWDALASTVLAELVRGKGATDDTRVWVAGCGTGQEAYTMAILLREAMNGRRTRSKVQIFGTDIGERAIAVARLGRYRAPIAGLSPARVERWFIEEGDDLRIVPEVRDMCVFSTHSIIKHPPFSRLDLISCRNLLIYLDADLQDRVMRTFHYALKPGGRLFLGSSESITRAARLFGVVDKKHRIFDRRDVDSPVLPELSRSGRRVETPPFADTVPNRHDDMIDKGARQVTEKHSPPHVVVDSRDQIVRLSGPSIVRYVELPPGAPSYALFDILRKGLRPAVRAALKEAREGGDAVRKDNVPVRLEGRSRIVSLTAERLAAQGVEAGFTVVLFQDVAARNSPDHGAKPDEDATDTFKALEQELRTTRTQLQSTIDELEISNEELKSSNEEHQSVNEELQSSNEELETAKEEMQSINEEVQTINSELLSKNEQLVRLNSDLKNLLESTQIATLFLDPDLRVKSFTPGVVEIFPLRDADIGRPITEIVGFLDYATLPRDAKTVLRKLTPLERQVSLRGGDMTFILRIRPYRTIDNVIDGVVLSFIDITERSAADQALRDTEAYLRLLIDSVADAVYCMDREGVTTLCNAAFLRLLGFRGEGEVIGAKVHDLIHHSHPDGSPCLQSECPIYQTALTGTPAHGDGESFFRTDGTSIPVEYWARPIVRGGGVQGAVCTFNDVSDRRGSEEQTRLLLRELDHRVKNLFAIVGGMVTLSARSASSPKELAQMIQGRLGSLASAHQLVRQSDPTPGVGSRATTLDALISTILSPYIEGAGEDERVETSGPKVRVGSEAVTSFALILHELATNAAKYGALSVAGGRVHISWSVAEDRLALIWEERGGPPIKAPPEHEGFGGHLARRSVNGQLGGELAFHWHEAGLVVHLSAAVERFAP